MSTTEYSLTGSDKRRVYAPNFAIATDVGLRREENQDAYGVSQSRDVSLFVVADGMGGARGGAHASKLAVNVVTRSAFTAHGMVTTESLERAIELANRVLHAQSKKDERLTGMGTTLVAVALISDRAIVACVGDSRVYFLRQGRIKQLTRDHTLVQDLVELGTITAEQALNHPSAHMLTRSLGPGPTVNVALTIPEGRLEEGDIFFLCCDGLYNHVSSEKIAEVVTLLDPKEAACELVNLANAGGGSDNITVQIVKITSLGAESSTFRAPRENELEIVTSGRPTEFEPSAYSAGLVEVDPYSGKFAVEDEDKRIIVDSGSIPGRPETAASGSAPKSADSYEEIVASKKRISLLELSAPMLFLVAISSVILGMGLSHFLFAGKEPITLAKVDSANPAPQDTAKVETKGEDANAVEKPIANVGGAVSSEQVPLDVTSEAGKTVSTPIEVDGEKGDSVDQAQPGEDIYGALQAWDPSLDSTVDSSPSLPIEDTPGVAEYVNEIVQTQPEQTKEAFPVAAVINEPAFPGELEVAPPPANKEIASLPTQNVKPDARIDWSREKQTIQDAQLTKSVSTGQLLTRAEFAKIVEDKLTLRRKVQYIDATLTKLGSEQRKTERERQLETEIPQLKESQKQKELTIQSAKLRKANAARRKEAITAGRALSIAQEVAKENQQVRQLVDAYQRSRDSYDSLEVRWRLNKDNQDISNQLAIALKNLKALKTDLEVAVARAVEISMAQVEESLAADQALLVQQLEKQKELYAELSAIRSNKTTGVGSKSVEAESLLAERGRIIAELQALKQRVSDDQERQFRANTVDLQSGR